MKRNPKRIIAFIMCVLIAASALIFNNASAAGISKIDSYESLVSNYGTAIGDDGLTDGFVYVGTEFYEEDGNLTDYFVNPGDKLTVKVYLKSNMYTADCNLITLFDNTFFDVKIVDDGAPTDGDGYTSMHEEAVINDNHPVVMSHGITHIATSKNLTAQGLGAVQKFCGFSQEYLENTDLVQNSSVINIQKSDAPYEMTSDEWIFSYYVHVKEDLAEGTKGIVDSPDAIWQSAIREVNGKTKHDPRMLAKVPVRHITEDVKNAGDFVQMASEMDKGTLDYFINDDMYHEFIIGEEGVPDVTDPPEYPTDTPDEPSDYPTDTPDEPSYPYYPDEPDYPSEPEYPTEPPTTKPTIPDVTVGNARIEILTPSTTEIKYGDGIILHADAVVPAGARIEWEANNSNFSYSYSADGTRCTVYSKEDGMTVFTAKVIDANGNVLCEDEQTLTSKAGFLWRIIAFFKQIFGLNRIIEQVIKF
ncbi:MAG: hypothetical protein IKW12_02715 [Clostridia bacterium]|nr:hypothetical protein [Clostridia bacterium]